MKLNLAVTYLATSLALAKATDLLGNLRKLSHQQDPPPDWREYGSDVTNRPDCTVDRSVLSPSEVFKDAREFANDLAIPLALHKDDGGDPTPTWKVALQEHQQQVLPASYPKTTQWAYGDPDRPGSFEDGGSFFNPAFTIETIKDKTVQVDWINGLFNKDTPSEVLTHIVQDEKCTPIVDQTIHWANPNKQPCRHDHPSGSGTDCATETNTAYEGPVPLVTHVHGAHVDWKSDGYAEAWWLPAFTNQDEYSPTGSYYNTALANSNSPWLGQARFVYSNDQPTTTLWYHDHSMGITRLNVYAAGAGFWLIREPTDTASLNRESGIKPTIVLPQPAAPTLEEYNKLHPHQQAAAIAAIREIPIAIQPKAFYDDGSLFYPANRPYFEEDGEGTDFDVKCKQTGNAQGDIKRICRAENPANWNPEYFPNMMVVNGRTWPKHQVDSHRYRLRLLNAGDSHFFNLALKYKCSTTDNPGLPPPNSLIYELPFYALGTDQGMRTTIAKVMTDPSLKNGQALLTAPGQRVDVVVDFGEVLSNCQGNAGNVVAEVFMTNTADPTGPYSGGDFLNYADSENEPFFPMMNVMKFTVTKAGAVDPSTSGLSVDRFVLGDLGSPGGVDMLSSSDVTKTRYQTLIEAANTIECTNGKIYEDTPFAPLFGQSITGGSPLTESDTEALYWSDGIQTNPNLGATEDWEISNFSADAHPIHVHLVKFQVVTRHCIEGCGDCESPTLLPWEQDAWIDTVLALPCQRTTIRAKFDIMGLYQHHCHILSHEDNEMMLPYCVGEPGVACPRELFKPLKDTCPSEVPSQPTRPSPAPKPTPRDDPQPACEYCSDDSSPWMLQQRPQKECKNSWHVNAGGKCSYPSRFKDENYCQKSCFCEAKVSFGKNCCCY